MRVHLRFAGGTACDQSWILVARLTGELERVTCPGCRDSVIFDWIRRGATVLNVRR